MKKAWREDVPCSFPRSLQEALAEWRAGEEADVAWLAGGTDLMVQWESGGRPLPSRVISIRQLPELQVFEREGDELVIGAAVTHWQLHQSPVVRTCAPALAAAAATVGGTPIQRMGTIGGNMVNASPAGDLAPALQVAEARVEVVGRNGMRCIPATAFWTDYRKTALHPGEMVWRIRVPVLPEGHVEHWRKLGARKAQAISKVMASCRTHITPQGTIQYFRIAVGSVAATCVRLTSVEEWLTGKICTAALPEEVEKRAAAAVQPIDDVRSTADYRRWVTGRLARSFVPNISETSIA